MATQKEQDAEPVGKRVRSLRVRRAAAEAAVAASAKTGRPVDERVRALAEGRDEESD